MPRVSINLCCYNSERYLDETLRSLVNQTYRDWELVIIDDGSTDRTDAIVRRYIAEGWPIVYHRQTNAGLAAARNEALRRSSGELIAFIDHDDLWEPRKLECQVPLFDRNQRIGLVYSDCLNVRDDGFAFRQYQKLRPHAGAAFGALFSHYFLSVQTVVVHRRALADAGWFDPQFQVLVDADFFLRIAHHWELAWVSEPLARIRMHRHNTTHARRDRFPIEMRWLLEKQRALHPDFDRRYAREVEEFLLQAARTEARIAWEQDQRQRALEIIRPYRHRDRAMARDFWLVRYVPYSFYERLRLLLSQPHRLSRYLGIGS